eukprot:3008091-Prorocentrum_lima.AAC.1
MEAAHEAPVQDRKKKSQALMRSHSSMWQKLPVLERERYEQRAELLAEERLKKVEFEAQAL